MFLDELTPIFQKLTSQPAAFLGGFASGLFKLNLTEDPVKSWLEDQGAVVPPAEDSDSNSKGPTTISID